MQLLRSTPCVLIAGLLLLSAAGAAAEDQVTQDRLDALKAAIAALGEPPAQAKPAVAEVCWTPHGQFSAEGIAPTAPYGTRGLAARYAQASSSTGQHVRVVWRTAKSKQIVSTGDCTTAPDSSSLENGFIKPAPLASGVYEVAFTAGGQVLAAGKITVSPPKDVGKRSLKDVDAEARKGAKTALAEIDASHAQSALDAALKAIPLLGAVIKAKPNDNSAAALYELAQMVVAVGKMEALASRQVPDRVLDWGLRAFGHASVAAAVAADPALRSKAQQYADVLQAALPKLAEAANKQQK